MEGQLRLDSIQPICGRDGDELFRDARGHGCSFCGATTLSPALISQRLGDGRKRPSEVIHFCIRSGPLTCWQVNRTVPTRPAPLATPLPTRSSPSVPHSFASPPPRLSQARPFRRPHLPETQSPSVLLHQDPPAPLHTSSVLDDHVIRLLVIGLVCLGLVLRVGLVRLVLGCAGARRVSRRLRAQWPGRAGARLLGLDGGAVGCGAERRGGEREGGRGERVAERVRVSLTERPRPTSSRRCGRFQWNVE